MRKGIFGFLGAMFLTLLCVTPLSAEQKIETIKVLVLEKGKSPIVEATGGYRIFDPADQRTIGGGMRGKRFALEAMNTGLKWGEQYPAVYQITIEPRRAGSVLLVDGVEYGGKIHAYQVGDQVNLVNEVPIDEYLRITLAHEFKEPLAPEVMAAVTIAARTNAYYMVEAGHRSYWHVRAEEVGYDGGIKSLRHGAIDQAVDETRDMVALRAGRPFPAVWTGHCGGKTCPYQLMFRHSEG
ncbi:MAG: hypothetical protein JSR80_03275, partial [Verrucomicrobia bacterium]|nr:hypothetical protein [Verrucomicrobiota bacterium]